MLAPHNPPGDIRSEASDSAPLARQNSQRSVNAQAGLSTAARCQSEQSSSQGSPQTAQYTQLQHETERAQHEAQRQPRQQAQAGQLAQRGQHAQGPQRSMQSSFVASVTVNARLKQRSNSPHSDHSHSSITSQCSATIRGSGVSDRLSVHAALSPSKQAKAPVRSDPRLCLHASSNSTEHQRLLVGDLPGLNGKQVPRLQQAGQQSHQPEMAQAQQQQQQQLQQQLPQQQPDASCGEEDLKLVPVGKQASQQVQSCTQQLQSPNLLQPQPKSDALCTDSSQQGLELQSRGSHAATASSRHTLQPSAGDIDMDTAHSGQQPASCSTGASSLHRPPSQAGNASDQETQSIPQAVTVESTVQGGSSTAQHQSTPPSTQRARVEGGTLLAPASSHSSAAATQNTSLAVGPQQQCASSKGSTQVGGLALLQEQSQAALGVQPSYGDVSREGLEEDNCRLRCALAAIEQQLGILRHQQVRTGAIKCVDWWLRLVACIISW